MYNANDIAEQLRIEKDELEKKERYQHGTIPGYIFAVSNDGGETGVCWRENAFDALEYLEPRKGMKSLEGYSVVLVKKK